MEQFWKDIRWPDGCDELLLNDLELYEMYVYITLSQLRIKQNVPFV